ncbi:MAG: DUF748 domain-containing protein [Verrucomicrobiota bacterium]
MATAFERPVERPARTPRRPGVIRRALDRWFGFSSAPVRVGTELVLLLLAIAAIVVWFGAPYVVRDYINRGFAGLPDYTGRVEWVRIHPLTASIDVYDFHIDKQGGGMPVPFLRSPRWNVALQWSELFHGVARASVTIFDPRVNLVSGRSSGDSQIGISGVWVDAIRALIPWRVNRLQVVDGDVHFLDFHADPQVDLECSHVNLLADNMSNSRRLQVALPATVRITANPLVTGFFAMTMAVNFDEKYATFTQNFKMEHVPAVSANSALQKYLKVRVKSGQIGLYSELTGDKGAYRGYVKPFFDHLEFEPKPADQGNVGAVWAGVLNTVKGVFEDDRKVIATQAPISGRVDDPQVNGWVAFVGVLWNAYIESLRPGFDRGQSPPPPTDTVTTPKSDQTRKETQQTSPAEKPTVDQVKARAQKENAEKK